MNMVQFAMMVRAIWLLKEEGLQYKEIDLELDLPRNSYRIMNGRRAKALVEYWTNC